MLAQVEEKGENGMQQNELAYLPPLDREIMLSYFSLSEAIAGLLGESCEVVIHRLGKFEQSVIKIINGHHTGRKVGSPITDKGLQLLNLYQNDKSVTQHHYFSHLPSGELIKSITHIIIGSSAQPIGLFCINFNLSYPLDKMMQSLMQMDTLSSSLKNEHFITHPHQLIETAFQNAVTEVEKYTQKNAKLYKKLIIRSLFENRIFELKEAVFIVAEKLSLTPHAIYKHLREFKK